VKKERRAEKGRIQTGNKERKERKNYDRRKK